MTIVVVFTISFGLDRCTGLIIVFVLAISMSLTVSVTCSLNRLVGLTISFAKLISVSVTILANLDPGTNLIILVGFHDNLSHFYHFSWFG